MAARIVLEPRHCHQRCIFSGTVSHPQLLHRCIAKWTGPLQKASAEVSPLGELWLQGGCANGRTICRDERRSAAIETAAIRKRTRELYAAQTLDALVELVSRWPASELVGPIAVQTLRRLATICYVQDSGHACKRKGGHASEKDQLALIVAKKLILCVGDPAVLVPNDLAFLIWSLARLPSAGTSFNCDRPVGADLAKKVLVLVATRAAELQPQNLANALWAAAAMRQATETIEVAVSTLSIEIQEWGFKGMTPRELASVAWASVKLRRPWTEVAQSTSMQVVQLVASGQPVDGPVVASLIWAAAAAAESASSRWLLDEAADALLNGLVSSLKTQELSSVLWALAFARGTVLKEQQRLGVCDPIGVEDSEVYEEGKVGIEFREELFVAMAPIGMSLPMPDIALEVIEEFYSRAESETLQPKGVASALWALASLRMPAPQNLQMQAARHANADLLARQDLVGVAWAIAIFPQREVGIARHVLTAVAGSSLRRKAVATMSDELDEWSIQGSVNMLWAIAASSVQGQPLLGAVAVDLLRDLLMHLGSRPAAHSDGEVTDRVVTSTAWALATLSLRHETGLVEASARGAARCVARGNLNLQDISCLVWSRAALEPGGTSDRPLLTVIAGAALPRIKAVITSIERVSAVGQQRDSLPNCVSMATSLTQIAWSFAALGPSCADESLCELVVSAARHALVAVGRQMDQMISGSSPPAVRAAVPALRARIGSPLAPLLIPRVVREGRGWCVVFKPPDWEVDTAETDHSLLVESGAQPLSAFLRSTYSAPICSRQDLDYGFLHRLDTPSSGLVFAALTCEALMLLRWFQATRQLGREYLVLCHGRLPHRSLVLDQPLRVGKFGGRSVVAADGQRARTVVSSIAEVCRDSVDEAYTILLVAIDTGRRHQIRTHLAAAGHAVVCDGRYAPDRLPSDRKWCPRNFLHRCRLELPELLGRDAPVEAPLPADLSAALSRLQPSDESSAAVVASLLRGEVPKVPPNMARLVRASLLVINKCK